MTQLREANGYILIVEDEADLADMLRLNLERHGYTCAAVGAGDEALRRMRQQRPDLVILDRMLPGRSGDDVLAEMGKDTATASVPVIMLTAKAEESDQLVGFALGAIDYVTKPFSMKVLLARVKAAMKHRATQTASEDEESISDGPIQIIPTRHEILVDGSSITVTATEFRIMLALMRARGRVLTRARMLDTALGEGVVVTDRTVDVHITSLRKKLGRAAAWVQTIRGVGYAFREPSGD